MKRVFAIGASGYIGSTVVRRLRKEQLEVIALSRDSARDKRLSDLGAIPVRGDTSGLGCLTREAARADAVIYVAVNNPSEHDALNAVVAALEGSGKPFIFTSGATLVAEATGGHFSARQVGEDDEFTPPSGSVRLSSEIIVRKAANRGIRSMTIRPPLVYGNGGSTQIPRYAHCGRTTGAVRYIGPGENIWGYVHVDELAECYVRLLEHGRAGQAYHTLAGEVRMRDLAGAVARALQLPTATCSVSEAEPIYGKWGAQVGMSSNCRPIAPVAEAHLKWRPERRDILEDVLTGSYFQAWRPQT